jgi:ABC-type amino acid transport substrate-binding protein
MGNTLLRGLIALAIALGLWNFYKINFGGKSADGQISSTRVERILNEKRLRVAYFVVPPLLERKPGSGQLSGPMFDFVNQMGANLSVKVDWVEEANLTTLSAGLDSNRYDLIAFPLWETGDRAKRVDFSIPLFYSPVAAYVRSNDGRFDSSLKSVNDKNITVAAIDGEMAGEIAKADYPNAKIDSKPQMVDYSQLLLEVAVGKSDITFFNELDGNRFMQKNPGKIKRVPTNRPVRLFSETLVLPEGDYRFKALIDSTLREMLQNGALESAMEANGINPKEYYMPALPYRDPMAVK